jgi:general secretion pathway protein E
MTPTDAPATPADPHAHRAPRHRLPRYDAAAFRASLLESGDLTDADLRLAEGFMRQQGTTELRAILDLGLLSEEALAERLASHMDAARWPAPAAAGDEPDDAQGPAPLVSIVPRGFMRANAVLALPPDDADFEPIPNDQHANDADTPRTLSGRRGDRLIIADPSDQQTLAALLAPCLDDPPQLLIATAKRIESYLERHARDGERVDASHDDAEADLSADLAQLRDMASEAPVIRFFNQAVERAMEAGASDIHLERYERDIHFRLRVDGVLNEQPPPAPSMYDALLTRIKIMAGLDIAERRRAQDGRVRMRLRGRNIDMRVSIVPTMYGQDAAIRIQDRQRLATVELSDLGFTDTQADALFQTAAKSHGILLITGPTGSGKTTTLYAILRHLVSAERKVMTVEDPVEYAMAGVNQIQVNPAIDLTFSNTLRHILRHDPDVILVGEIRDSETARMAFQASLTGHMVLSTLHTNDVASSFVRLVDMGVEPYLVNAGVEGVSAQRLLRKLDPDATARAGESVYRGRVAVMEFSRVTPALKRVLAHNPDEQAVAAALEREGFEPMRHAADRLAARGVTDRAEVARVLGAEPPPDDQP